MIYSKLLTSTGPETVYVSTDTGESGGTRQPNAITTIIVCNVGTPDLNDESLDAATITINLVRYGLTPPDSVQARNIIVKDLFVPAGETVFFSDEKIILSGGDQIIVTASAANLIAVTTSVLNVGIV
jgi:hypothetical protein